MELKLIPRKLIKIVKIKLIGFPGTIRGFYIVCIAIRRIIGGAWWLKIIAARQAL